MKRFIIFAIVILMYIPLLCRKNADKEPEVKIIDGSRHIYNPEKPQRGAAPLMLEKSLTIDPSGKKTSESEEAEEIFFDDYEKDEQGNVYLLDRKGVRIHKFDNKGKYLGSFLKKGEGPGEFPPFPRLQVMADRIYVIGPRKIAWFDLDGKFLNEKKLDSYYTALLMIDPQRFIAKYLKYPAKSSVPTESTCNLYRVIDEQKILTFFRSEHTGRFFIDYNKRPLAIIPSPGIVPDIIYGFDRNSKRVLAALNNDYKFYVFNLDGKIEMVVHKKSSNAPLEKKDKVDVADSLGRVPEPLKKKIISGLPATLCAIESLSVLPKGHILVRNIKGYKKIDLDVFSREGVYLQILKIPPDLNLEKIKFYKGVVTGIETRDDTNVYHEYKIKSHSDIF